MPLKGTCKICSKTGELTRHHLIPKSLSSKFEMNKTLSNHIIKICAQCHRSVHQHSIDHVFIQRRFTKFSKIDMLKFHVLLDFLKKKHPDVHDTFKKEWVNFLQEELKKEQENCSEQKCHT